MAHGRDSCFWPYKTHTYEGLLSWKLSNTFIKLIKKRQGNQEIESRSLALLIIKTERLNGIHNETNAERKSKANLIAIRCFQRILYKVNICYLR